ncbi:diguanylate cyclase [Oceanicola sp. 22II-s10i]|uniref:GGDEF domain-containing protein n=1 Tax=Oceanicola sp. 22II-s10i TaxID=1317116 RepID=UPI000B7144E4|nr:GGDEF domain-containing protein [Oceanicola sp. 22II-s10i]OWU82898.1 diguanylate cyclase [Oceanicola sp. 22II-s10i]
MAGCDNTDDMLDLLCPMHLRVDPSGVIAHAGPSLAKLRPAAPFAGTRFADRFDLLQPALSDAGAGLADMAGRRLRLRFRDRPATMLVGIAARDADGGAIVNLSFGISIVEAVRDYTLTIADFAPTDLAVELLFLVETKSAAMAALQQMSQRFNGARMAAEEQALTDPGTGLRNRRALDLALERMISDGQEFALMHVDLDRFKQVNDTLGHAAGDHVLRQAAHVMSVETRAEDTLARVGGDEFVLLFHRLCDRDRLGEIAARLIARLEMPIDWQGHRCGISASAGTAISIDYDNPSAARMLADADEALYAAKRAGRGRHRFHPDG